MISVRKGLRAGEISKDTYDRLVCAECGVDLGKRADPEDQGVIRYCPRCAREWRRVG